MVKEKFVEHYVLDMLDTGRVINLRALKSATPEKYREKVEPYLKRKVEDGSIIEVHKGRYKLAR